jgi:hypothetical protein
LYSLYRALQAAIILLLASNYGQAEGPAGVPFSVTVSPRPDIEHTLTLPGPALGGIEQAVATVHTPLSINASTATTGSIGGPAGDPFTVTLSPRPDIEHTLTLPAAALGGIERAAATVHTPLSIDSLTSLFGLISRPEGVPPFRSPPETRPPFETPPQATPPFDTSVGRPDGVPPFGSPRDGIPPVNPAALGGIERALQTGNAPWETVNTGVQGGNVTISAGRYVNAGRLAPGNSPGMITVDGDFAQSSSGVLAIEIGGTAPGTQYDVLNVTGDAFLGGTLAVSLIDNFIPLVGDEFAFLNVGGLLSGDFQSVTFDGLPKGLGFDLLRDEQSLRLVAKSVRNPEPASIAIWSLISLGVMAFGYCRRRAPASQWPPIPAPSAM